MKQTQEILGLLLPPRQNAAEAVHPTVRPFDNPPASLEAGLMLDGLRFLSTGSDMCCVAELIRQFSGFVVIVPLVQAHSLRSLPRRLGTFDRDAFQGRLHHLEVIAVGSLNGQADGHAVRLRQQAALDTVLGTIGGVWPAFFPRPAGPWSWPHPSTAMPNRSLSTCHTPTGQLPKTAGKRPPGPTAGSDHGRCCWDKCSWHSARSIGCMSASQR